MHLHRLKEFENGTYVAQTDLATSYSLDIDMGAVDAISIQLDYADVTPADARTFDSGAYEVQTLTFDTKANTTHQDLVIAYDQAGLTYAIALTKPVAEVQTLTFPDKATAVHQDFIVVEDTVGTKYAVALTKPVAAVDTLNVADKASTTGGDYAAFYDAAGLRWAFALNVSGADPEPTGAIWTSIAAARKVNVDISSATNDEDITPLVETALNALTGFSAAFTTDDSAADGTMLITRDAKGLTQASVVKNADDSGAGSIALTTTTAGVTSEAPTGPIWTAATHKGLADISGDTTPAQVAARAETAFNALTGFTAAITSNDTAADGTMLLTQVLKAPTTNPVPKNAAESGAGTILGVQTTGGVASTAPSGALWTAVAAGRKGLADISGDTTAAQVAARAETAFNLLTGFTDAITTDDTAANGTMLLTQTVYGPTTNPVPKNADESGAGSIAGVQTTAGVTSEIDLVANEITVPAHGFLLGQKVAATTSAADFPAGLSATNYYVIVVDEDTIKLATSAALAVLGTAVDITDEGSGVHTLTPSALGGVVVKLQVSNDGETYKDLGTHTVTISAAGTTIWDVGRIYTRYLRVLHTPSAGAIDLAITPAAWRD